MIIHKYIVFEYFLNIIVINSKINTSGNCDTSTLLKTVNSLFKITLFRNMSVQNNLVFTYLNSLLAYINVKVANVFC